MAIPDHQMQALLRVFRRSQPTAQGAAKPPVWNSLEITKLCVSLLTPIVIAVATYQYNVHKDLDVQQQERLRRVVAKRVELWDAMAPKMNDIYCYFLYVGRWKEMEPQEIIERKRDLDALLYSNRILFSQPFFESYQEFMSAAFEMYRGGDRTPG